jgi:hypothetical protein
MYENVYEEMVKAGIAEEKEEEIEYETGLSSKFQLTKSEFLLFVDETGCNTNQLNDGRVGGELFVVPKIDNEAGAPIGSTTDLHFTVLGFISGTGEALMCAIIFKSDLPVSEIPVSWKSGLDITCTTVRCWLGGLRALTWVNKYPVSLGPLPRLVLLPSY